MKSYPRQYPCSCPTYFHNQYMLPAIIAFGIFVLTRAAARKNTVPQVALFVFHISLFTLIDCSVTGFTFLSTSFSIGISTIFYYKKFKAKNRVYYEYYCLDRTEVVPADYIEISFVCLRPDGCLELPAILETVCRKIEKIRETTVDASIN